MHDRRRNHDLQKVRKQYKHSGLLAERADGICRAGIAAPVLSDVYAVELSHQIGCRNRAA